MAEVQFPARKTDFSLLHSVQTNSGTHPASYPVGGRCFFSNWNVKLTTLHHPVLRLRMVELYLHSPLCHNGLMLNSTHRQLYLFYLL
jgi:hypothetical protein